MSTALSPTISPLPDPSKPGPSRKRNKDPKKASWRDNYANQRLSGIEFKCHKTGEIVHFTAIQHKDLHKADDPPFRVIVTLGENRQIISIPRKQTFEEMIQAKRRQQNLLYAASHSNTTSTALSDRAARRVSAAARRRATARATVRPSSSQPVQEPIPTARSRAGRPSGASSSSASRRARAQKQKRPSKPSRSSTATSSPVKLEPQVGVSPSTSTTSTAPLGGPTVVELGAPAIAAIAPSSSFPAANPNFKVRTTLIDDKNRLYDRLQIISSMKELSRKNPSLGSLEKKEIKRMLKSAPPGSALVLPNGTMVRKSRRGGARAGAGRKRNRPPGAGEGSPNKDSLFPQSDSSNLSFSTPNSKSNQSIESSVNIKMEPPTTSAVANT